MTLNAKINKAIQKLENLKDRPYSQLDIPVKVLLKPTNFKQQYNSNAMTNYYNDAMIEDERQARPSPMRTKGSSRDFTLVARKSNTQDSLQVPSPEKIKAWMGEELDRVRRVNLAQKAQYRSRSKNAESK